MVIARACLDIRVLPCVSMHTCGSPVAKKDENAYIRHATTEPRRQHIIFCRFCPTCGCCGCRFFRLVCIAGMGIDVNWPPTNPAWSLFPNRKKHDSDSNAFKPNMAQTRRPKCCCISSATALTVWKWFSTNACCQFPESQCSTTLSPVVVPQDGVTVSRCQSYYQRCTGHFALRAPADTSWMGN